MINVFAATFFFLEGFALRVDACVSLCVSVSVCECLCLSVCVCQCDVHGWYQRPHSFGKTFITFISVPYLQTLVCGLLHRNMMCCFGKNPSSFEVYCRVR